MLSLPIPDNGSLVFRPWTLQALSGSLAGGFKLSGPATFSLN